MLTSAKLSPNFWAEATATAAYVRNRMIHATLNDGVPEGIWNGRSPSVKHLKAYGCLAYAHLPYQGRGKLEPRARICTLVGYSSQTKGYRLWDNNKKEIIQTKHVRFDETKLGYHGTKNTTNQILSIFPHDDYAERDSEPEEETQNEQEDFEHEDDENNIKKGYARPEPILTRSRTVKQREAEEHNKNTSIGSDNEDNTEDNMIVGASGGQAKRIIRNPYGRKGKPKEQMEINLTQVREPQNLKEAKASPESAHWMQAINEELNNLKRLQTWEEVEETSNVNCIESKWIFKIKRDANGEIARFKARLVARGFSQKEGIDYDQTYAPVARFAIVRLFLAMSVIFGWTTRHMDIKCAYLNGQLKEQLHMRLPTIQDDEKPRIVKLLRPIYGLKQSGHNWNETINSFLIENGFVCLKSSNCTYRYDLDTFLIIYVDDIAIFSRSEEKLNKIVHIIEEKYEARDLGEISYFLGVNILRNPEGNIQINQRRYIQELLDRYGLQECRTAYIPMEPGNLLSSKDSPTTNEEKQEMKSIPYRELIGSLNYISQCTRPDIAFAVSKLAQFSSNPGRKHWNEAKRTLRYLGTTMDHNLTYDSNDTKVSIWSDADWAGNPDDRHSYSGNIIMLGKNVTDWKASKQKCIATSTMEAEYIAMSSAAKEAKWLKMFLEELRLNEWMKTPYQLHCDNRSAIDFSKNRIERNKTKHIDIAFHNVRENIDNGTLNINYIPSSLNVADILTKAMTRIRLEEHIKGLNLKSDAEFKSGGL